MPRWVLKPYIDSKELTELVITPNVRVSQQTNLGVFLLYQKQRYQVPKVKAAVDFLVGKVKGNY